LWHIYFTGAPFWPRRFSFPLSDSLPMCATGWLSQRIRFAMLSLAA
jgi:hypothetical protein